MLRVSSGVRRGALCAMFLLAFSSLQAQVFEWTTMGDGEAWKRGADITIGSNGRSFAVGKFAPQPTQTPLAASLIAFGGQPSLTITGSTDAFVVMHSATGTLEDLLQLKSVAAGDAVTATGIVIDNGALYITGEISGRVDFQGLAGIVDALPRSSYIAKIDVTTNPSDELVVAWVALLSPTAPNSGTVRATAIDVHDGFVYITGALDHQVVAMSAGGSSQTADALPPPSAPSLFIARYTVAGLAEQITVTEPAQGASSVGTAIVAGTVLDNFNIPRTRVAAVGTSRGDISLLGQTHHGEDDADNMMLAIVDDGGSITTLTGATKASPTAAGRITGRAVAVNSDGDLYVTGDLGGTVRFAGSSTTLSPVARRDFYIAKFGALNGNFQSAMRGGASLTSEAYATGIAINEQTMPRQVYITGALAGTMQLGAYSVTSMGNHDVLVARFDEPLPGNFVVNWVRRAGNISTVTDRHHQDQGTAIAVTTTGNAYVIGEFGATGDPLPDAEFFATPSLVAAEQYRNIFIGRISSTALLVRGQVRFDALPSPMPIARHRVTVSVPLGLQTVIDEVMTGADGWYTAWTPTGRPYTIAADPLPHFELDAPWPNPFHLGTLSDTSLGFLFDTTASDTAFDLRVEITPVGTEYAVPGTERCYRITYRNHGAGTAPGGTTIHFDAADALYDPLVLPPVDPEVVSTTGAYLLSTAPYFTFQIDGPIPPLGTGELVVCFDFKQTVEPDPPITSDTDLLSTVTIANAAENPSLTGDNAASIDDDVFFPLDPNIKTSIPSGTISIADVRSGHEIEYMIDFYNLGPNRAQTVTVVDELPHAYFDHLASDFVTVLSGSPGTPTPTIAHFPGASVPHSTLTFVFTQADLLAMHEGIDGSRGFIRFTAKLHRSLPLNTVVTNQAKVRFDAQHWFTTNVATNCVGPGFGVENICLGETANFTTSLNGESFLPVGAGNLQWSFGDGATATDTRASHRYEVADTFVVTLRFQYEGEICGSRGDAGIHTITRMVIISPLPAKPVIVRTGAMLSTDPASRYEWFRDGQSIGTTPTIDSPQPGVYTVRVENEAGCAMTSDPFTVVPGAARDDRARSGAVSVAPNPGGGSFRLTLARPAREAIAVSVYDAAGRVVRRLAIERGSTSCLIDLSGAAAGAYSASLSIDGHAVTQAFVLRR